jgi:Holliday junction resolvase
MTYKKIDRNQNVIVIALRNYGYSVKSTAGIGKGFPDIIVGSHGRNYLFEIKASKKEKLTLDEKVFKISWRGQYKVITTAQEIIEIIEKDLYEQSNRKT